MTVFSRWLSAAVVVILAIAGGSAANAHPSPMITGGLTSQPIGHYEFCKRNPDECAVRTRGDTPVAMTNVFMERLQRLTVKVNQAVRPVSDLDLYKVNEYWTYPVDAGDCEDYALQKRRILMTEGIQPSNLLLTVLRRPNGEGHAVLTVRTDIGDVVLDNLTDLVMNWDETPYKFLKRQATGHTGRWVTIREGDAPLVGSLH